MSSTFRSGSRSGPRRSTRGLAAGLLALAMTGSACQLRASSSSQGAVEEAVDAPMPVDPPAAEGEPNGKADGDAEARPVEAREDIENPTPTAWDRVSYQRETNELTVFWWSGVEPCTGLAGVEVDYLEDEVVVTVLEGAPPEAATMMCVAMAEHKQYTLALDEDLAGRQVVDGAA